MPITHLRTLSVPSNMQATRLAGNPTGKGSVIGRDAPIAVMHQEADGSFTPAGMVTTAHTPEMKVTAPLPPDASESRSKPEFQVAVDQALPQSTGMAVPAPANPKAFVSSPAPTPAAVPPPETKRVRVRMSNRGMGRVTVSVRAVSISEACVVLAYPVDADNIVEPPLCDSQNPIKVEYEGNSFRCVFGGWTTELEGMFLIIMLRADEEEGKAP
jgi:hypothetical protein